MFDFLEKNSNSGEIFNLAMTDFSAFVAHALLLSYDFTGIKSLVDVGGGCGKLLTSILEVYPGLQGVILDLPGVVDAACERIRSHACRDRCSAISGNFFQSIPRGGDLYLLSGVIHDWDDEKATTILRNCRKAANPGGKLLLVELVIAPGNAADIGKVVDLEMLAIASGQERTEVEYRQLLASAGWRLTRVIPTKSPTQIIEADPV